MVGEYERAFYGSQYALTAPLFGHYGVQLWMPEAGGRVDFASEHDEQAMTVLGLSSSLHPAQICRLGQPPDAPELVEALVLGVVEITEAETEHWITYFSTSVDALRQQANPGVSSAQHLFTWGSKDGLSAG